MCVCSTPLAGDISTPKSGRPHLQGIRRFVATPVKLSSREAPAPHRYATLPLHPAVAAHTLAALILRAAKVTGGVPVQHTPRRGPIASKKGQGTRQPVAIPMPHVQRSDCHNPQGCHLQAATCSAHQGAGPRRRTHPPDGTPVARRHQATAATTAAPRTPCSAPGPNPRANSPVTRTAFPSHPPVGVMWRRHLEEEERRSTVAGSPSGPHPPAASAEEGKGGSPPQPPAHAQPPARPSPTHPVMNCGRHTPPPRTHRNKHGATQPGEQHDERNLSRDSQREGPTGERGGLAVARRHQESAAPATAKDNRPMRPPPDRGAQRPSGSRSTTPRHKRRERARRDGSESRPGRNPRKAHKSVNTEDTAENSQLRSRPK